MFGPTAAYVIAISTVALCAVIARTLITTVKHFDPPDAREGEKAMHEKAAA